MRLLTLSLTFAFCMLTGCAVISPPPPPESPPSGVSAADLGKLSLGEWCRVDLVAVNDGSTRTRATHLGQITQVDYDSITITNVTTHFAVTNDVNNEGTGAYREEPAEVIVPRDKMDRLNRITAEVAEKLKESIEKPRERVGVDFNHNLNWGFISRLSLQ